MKGREKKKLIACQPKSISYIKQYAWENITLRVEFEVYIERSMAETMSIEIWGSLQHWYPTNNLLNVQQLSFPSISRLSLTMTITWMNIYRNCSINWQGERDYERKMRPQTIEDVSQLSFIVCRHVKNLLYPFLCQGRFLYRAESCNFRNDCG